MATEKAEVILSSSGTVVIQKGDFKGTFTPEQLFRLLKKHKAVFKQVDVSKLEIVANPDLFDIPPKRGKVRSGEDYILLRERLQLAGFTDKNIEHNVLDLQQMGSLERKWRKDGLFHLPSFLMEASEEEIRLVVNYKFLSLKKNYGP